MFIKEATLDDLLRRVFTRLLTSDFRVKSSRGDSRERFGVLLKLTNPRARLSRTESKGTLFSALGELLWYLAGSDRLDFIRYYVRQYEKETEDHETIHGAYGPRLYGMGADKIDQVENVLRQLRNKEGTRRAVIQIFDCKDLTRDFKEIPCTCTLQFVIRKSRLHLMTSMRSNDAFLGLPHDVFAFTMIQELFARSLGVRVGTYTHAVGSLHLYDEHEEKARRYLNEGWQRSRPRSTVSMPPMPLGDPWTHIKTVVQTEVKVREGDVVDASELDLPDYWRDMIRLLQIYRAFVDNEKKTIKKLKKELTTALYDSIIDRKEKGTYTALPPLEPRQLRLI